MSIIENIILKLNINEIGKHLANYTDLYTKPLYVWKKIIGNRSSSYNLIVLHIIYYLIFIDLVIDKPFNFVIFYALLELALTIIPFLIFFVPFKAFTTILRKHIKWDRLFRLFIVLKLQFIPIIILLFMFAKWSEIDGLYLIANNLIFVLIIAFIVVFPLISSISIWQKLIWILTNYIFFLIFLTIFGLSGEKIEGFDRFVAKMSSKDPSSEYSSLQMKLSNSLFQINDDYYLLIVKPYKKDSVISTSPLFVTSDLLIQFWSTENNRFKTRIKEIDSLDKIKYKINTLTNKETWIDSLEIFPKSLELNKRKLDSINEGIRYNFYELTKLMVRLKDSAKFESNRQYLTAVYDYLINYEKPHRNFNLFYKIITTKTDSIRLEDNSVALLYKIDSTYYYEAKHKYLLIENKLNEREEKNNYIFYILFYPLDILFDKFGFYD